MDQQDAERPYGKSIEGFVRSNAGSAALAAGLLIFFGFFQLDVQTGTDLFSKAGTVFVYTLRIGGLAMAMVAVWCCFGQPLALFVDAIVSIIIGALMLVTSGLMLYDGGMGIQTILSMMCSLLFLSAGLRNGRDFFAFASDEPEDAATTTTAAASAEGTPLAGQLGPNPDLIRMKQPEASQQHATFQGGRFAADDEALPLPDTEPLSLADIEPPAPPKPHTGGSLLSPGIPPAPDVPPAPDGFLADLAGDEQPRQP